MDVNIMDEKNIAEVPADESDDDELRLHCRVCGKTGCSGCVWNLFS